MVLTLPPDIKVRYLEDRSSSGPSEDRGCGSHPPYRDQGETLTGQVVFWSFRGQRMWFSPSLQRSRSCRTGRLLVLQRTEDVVLTLPPDIKVRYLEDRSSSGPSEDVGCSYHPPTRNQGDASSAILNCNEQYVRDFDSFILRFGKKNLSRHYAHATAKAIIKHKIPGTYTGTNIPTI